MGSDSVVGMLTLLFLFACGEVVLNDLPAPGDAENLIFIFHGSGDNPDDWPLDLTQLLQESFADNQAERAQWDVWSYDWDEYAQSKLYASDSGLELGELISFELLEDRYSYSHIHLVGHSVGSFVIHGMAKAFDDLDAPITLHSTFLDPFTGNGLFDWSYGESEFGRYADFAESYYNKDDSVPSTNGQLEFAHNFDVTALRPADYNEDKPHWWPTDFYIDSVLDETGVGFSHSVLFVEQGVEFMNQQFPSGMETILED